jgi:hypothetical protein
MCNPIWTSEFVFTNFIDTQSNTLFHRAPLGARAPASASSIQAFVIALVAGLCIRDYVPGVAAA